MPGRALLKKTRRTDAHVVQAIESVIRSEGWEIHRDLPASERLSVDVAVLIGDFSSSLTFAAPMAGRLTDRFGPGSVAAGGLFVEATGLALASRVTADSQVVIVCVAIGLVGAGVGLFSVANMTQVMGALGDEQQGVAGAVTLVMRTVGITAGVVVASAIFRAQEATAGFFPAFERTLLVMAAVALGAAVVAVPSRGVVSRRRGSGRPARG